MLDHFGHELISESATSKKYSMGLAEQPRILGVSTGGKQITLARHVAAGSTMNFPGIATGTYRHELAFIGKHFDDTEKLEFDKIDIRASDLNAWTMVSGFRPEHYLTELEKGGLNFTGFKVEFEAPDDIEVALSRGEKAAIRFSTTSKGLDGRSTEISAKQDAELRLRFRKRTSIDVIADRVGQVRNLLTLAVGRPVTILGVTGYRDDVLQGNGDPLPIEFFWSIPYNPEPPTRTQLPHDMFFLLPDAAPDFSTVMRNWFAKQKRLQPVFNLFFGARYHPNLPLEVEFLTYAQAIETYDYRRRRKPGKKTLAERMEDVLDDCRTVSAQIVGPTVSDREAFVQRFKDSRNYYTHYNPKKEKKAAKGAALLKISTQLQALLEMSLLRQLGFGCRAIDKTLERTRRYAEIAHYEALADEESD